MQELENGYRNWIEITMRDRSMIFKVSISREKSPSFHEFTDERFLTGKSRTDEILSYLKSRFGGEIKDPSNNCPIIISLFDRTVEIHSKLDGNRKIFETILRSRLDRVKIDPALLNWVVSGLQLYYDESNIRS